MTLRVSKHVEVAYFVISTIIVTDIYVHSLVELKIIKKCTVPLLKYFLSISFCKFLID